jgi:hypothetical protein
MNTKKLFLACSVFSVFPVVVFAQPASYELLAPIGTVTQVSSFGAYLKIVFEGTIGVAGVLAVVMIVICGIKMMTTEAISSRGEAKQCITNAIIGLLLAIGSWLILNTINPVLLDTTLGITLPDTQDVSPTTRTPTTQELPNSPGWYFQYEDANKNKKFVPAAPASDGGEKCQAVLQSYKDKGFTIIPTSIEGVSKECFLVRQTTRPVPANEADMRFQICGERSADGCLAPSNPTAGKIYVNKKACPNPGVREKECTSVGGLDPAALAAIRNIAAQGCPVVISGGTERDGHTEYGGTSDHYPNLRPTGTTFDLRIGNPCVDDYLKKNGLNKSTGNKTTSGIPSCPGGRTGTFCGNSRWYLNGFWFVEERFNDKGTVFPHWHVCKHGSTGTKGNPAGPTAWCNDPPP